MRLMFLTIKSVEEPRSLQADIRDVDNWPVITECAWCIWSDQDEEDIQYRSSEEIGEEQLIDDLIKDLECCSLLVTHDISVDYRILAASMIRNKKRLAGAIQKRGTKYQGRLLELCPANFWDYRWPSLSWLFEELFEVTGVETGYSLVSDVVRLKDCYLEMKNRGVL